jgi:hypothetical protein
MDASGWHSVRLYVLSENYKVFHDVIGLIMLQASLYFIGDFIELLGRSKNNESIALRITSKYLRL